jgi:uncharacterized membrane protein YdjX (TVP38/TMEM64 family)
MSEADKKNPRNRAASPGPKEKAVANDTEVKTDKSASSSVSIPKIAAGVAVLAALYFMRSWLMKDFTKNFLTFCEYVRQQGAFGVLIYIVMLAIWIVLCLPCTIVEMVPGFLFGFWQGTIVSMIGKNLGNLIALVLGQTLLRDWVKKRTKEYDILEKVDAAIKHDGFIMVLLVRAVFLPMAVKNYGLAALGVSIPQNMAGAILSGLPFSLAWSYVGSTAQSLVEIAEGKKGMSDLDLSPATMAVGAVVCAGLFGLTGWYMKRAFDAAIKAGEERQKKEKAQKAE